MRIKENEKLAPYTTFKIGGEAKFFCATKNETELRDAIKFANDKSLPMLFLGGGSNMLISDKGFEGLAILMDIKGLEVQESDDFVILKVAPGEIWDSVVALAVKHNWWGIENLSHIPGKTGAIAVQNVGAYGQEAGQVVEEVTAFDLKTGELRDFSNQECGFGYRSSIFNGKEKGRYAIICTYLKLSKQPQPNLWYRDLNLLFAGRRPAISEIRQAIINIRDKKFPFPKESKNGNAGSFFKNAIIGREEYQKVKEAVEKNISRQAAETFEQKKISLKDEGHVKIPTALLLDICGLKGIKNKNAAINPNQPLVIINYTGKAKASDVLELAAQVLSKVKQKTGLTLQVEPELIGFSFNDLKSYGII
jgi:UDP-N-acetylmuramate dehydrogenase